MNSNPIDLSIGSDPELMLWDNERGIICSALTALDFRTKHNPIDLGDGMKMYADNVLVEVSFPPVNANGDSSPFRNRISDAIGRMEEKLGKRYRVKAQASHVFDSRELDHPTAWESGCNPNHDAYTETMNLPADFTQSGPLRTGSFHIHLGNNAWVDDGDGPMLTNETRIAAIKLFDIYAGCSSVIFDKDPTGPARRALYGKAGEYRPTPYGVEARCLGNWALSAIETVGLVYDLATFAVRRLETPDWKDILAEINPRVVQEAINTNNPDLARWVIANAELPQALIDRVEAVQA